MVDFFPLPKQKNSVKPSILYVTIDVADVDGAARPTDCPPPFANTKVVFNREYFRKYDNTENFWLPYAIMWQQWKKKFSTKALKWLTMALL